jgi:hypothetical protein
MVPSVVPEKHLSLLPALALLQAAQEYFWNLGTDRTSGGSRPQRVAGRGALQNPDAFGLAYVLRTGTVRSPQAAMRNLFHSKRADGRGWF